MSWIERQLGGPWMNEHRNRIGFMRATASLHEDGGNDLVTTLAERRRVIGDFVAEHAARGREICVTGSAWSQSDLFRRFATRLDTGKDEGMWELPDEAFLDGVEGRHRFVMVTGGTKIHRLMGWLGAAGRDLSLCTAGSHKGQSIAGLAGTGSHGSTFAETGCETHVRGVVFSTGSGEAVWLGDPDRTVLRDDWVAQFATLGDPAHFAAARVHLGGMGFVSAYLIEAVEEFYCGVIRRARVLPPDWGALVAQGKFAEAIGKAADTRRPHYYEITFDPFRGKEKEVLETIWLGIDAETKPDAFGEPINHTTLEAIVERGARGVVEMACNPVDPMLPEAMVRDLIDVPDMIFDDFKEHLCDERDVPRTLSQLTAEWHPHTLMGIRVDVYNAAFAVPRERLPEVLDIARGMAEGEDGVRQFATDFVFTVRFARKSPATLGFLRFEHNAIINIDGLPTNFILGTDAHMAAERLQYLLDKAGIPFAMHWGKDAQMDAAAIRRQYGDAAVDAYRAARAALLGRNAQVFTSPALEQWGLA